MRKLYLEEKFILQLIDIDGRIIPSINSIESIWNKLKNDDAKKLFCHTNNENAEMFNCFYNPEDCISIVTDTRMKSAIELRVKLMQIVKRQSEILDIDISFSMIWQIQATIEWFDDMRGNTRGADTQRLRKKFSKLYRIKIGKSSSDNFKMSRVKDNPILEQYPEYVVARNIFDAFNFAATVTAKIDPEMNNLLISMADIAKQFCALVEVKKIEVKKDEYLFECPFCYELSTLPQGKALSHCKSPVCKTAYFTKQKQIHNPKKGWIKDPAVKPRSCVGGCGSDRKNLNENRICRECYYKSFSEL